MLKPKACLSARWSAVRCSCNSHEAGPFPARPPRQAPQKTPVNLDLVEALASIGCTLEEIGAVIGVSQRTLIRWEQVEAFREAIERGRSGARVSIRRALWKSAEAGNVKAQIWLGKRLLGQRS